MQEQLYLLWGEGTQSWKIGYTKTSVRKRAAVIEACSAVPIRIVATRLGTMKDERAMHASLARYRSHGEWFVLPESVAWMVLAWFGVTRERTDG